jgi:N-glycosylase/DNA lyase
LAEILDGGQAFRWYPAPDETWVGTWGNQIARLKLGAGGALLWGAPRAIADTVRQALPRYLGADANFAGWTDALPWRSDEHLARCIGGFPGLRILRQPLGETLLGFLCSATKQIVQIKQMVALLAERHGQRITTPATNDVASSTFHRLPTWDELATVPEPELRACLLGFRAKYIAETARFLARNPGWLEQTELLPYKDAKQRLCTLPGVGEKVADCVLLFGAGRLEAFPVDVWILKTMAARYGLHGWKPAQLTQFGRVHFGRYAGLAQQFLFAWERRVAPRTRTA